MKNLFLFLFLLPLCSWAQNPTVTITSVSPATLCAGAQITVNYTSTATAGFNPGASLIFNGNIISSDPTAGDTGTLTGTIPTTTGSGTPFPSGTYSISVLRISSVYLGPTYETRIYGNGATLTVNSPQPPKVITRTSSYCLNDPAISLAASISAIGPVTWYASFEATSGTSQAPTPSTSILGSQQYTFSQNVNGCESIKDYVQAFVTACNVTDGVQAGQNTTIGSNNVFVGVRSGLTNTAGSSNVFIGDRAGFLNTVGNSNTFIGNLAGYNNLNGQANMFLGPQAGSNSTTGNYNVFLGNAAANANTTGSDNTAIGAGSAAQNTTGQRNTFLGEYAGFNSQTGNENVFIGFGTKAGTVNPTNLNNAVAIGANAIVNQSNSVILGNSISSVGIGNSAPKNKLEITQGTANQSGLRLTNLTSASPASLTNQSKFLTVNDQGDVILASLNGSGRIGLSESLWERKGSFLQSVQGEAIIIGSKVAQTPAGYKLFVEDGILTEKVKVAVKNTAEWSDKVFAPSYSLRPLSEVALYIDKHQHLPGIPSAQQMVEQGNDLHKTDAKLLEKIEELTLYSIQLEKTNQQQQTSIQQLQTEVDDLRKLVKQLVEKK